LDVRQKDLIKNKSSGCVERIRSMQVRSLNSILAFDRLARVIENEKINGNMAYALSNVMNDLTSGLCKVVKQGKQQIPFVEIYNALI